MSLLEDIEKSLIVRVQDISFFSPTVIWDLSSRAADQKNLLKMHYPNANFVVQPRADQPVDLIFANIFLLSEKQAAEKLQICRRQLKPDGRLFFTTWGVGDLYTLYESPDDQKTPSLKKRVGAQSTSGRFYSSYVWDLQTLGDLLLKVGFSEPVIDLEHITVQSLPKRILVQGNILFACAKAMHPTQKSTDISVPLTDIRRVD